MNKFELSEDVSWGDELTQLQIDRGEGCRKGVEGCRCRIGYRPQDQCPDCREEELRDSWCYCGPADLKSAQKIMNRLACNLAAQLDVTRIVFVTIENPYQHENDTYLWLYLETSNSPMISVRLKGKPDELQRIIDAERALREANDYRPFEWTKV